ncbi:MAG: response regulator [Blastocatellia bacterium]|nr:response regulator [Blastocatellia bacterium]
MSPTTPRSISGWLCWFLVLMGFAWTWPVWAQTPKLQKPDAAGGSIHSVRGRPALRVFSDQDGLPNTTIQCITRDRRGFLWVGTREGAAYYNGRTWKPVHMPNRRLSDSVLSVVAGADGSMWFGTNGGGVCRLKDGAWTVLDTSSGLPHNQVKCLFESQTETGVSVLWVGTNKGLGRWLEGEWKTYTKANAGLENDYINVVDEVRRSNGVTEVWIGTNGGGVVRLTLRGPQLEPVGWDRFRSNNSELPSDNVRFIKHSQLSNGEQSAVWIGTENGLALLEAYPVEKVQEVRPPRWTLYNQPHLPLRNLPVYAVLEEFEPSSRTPVLWVGTWGGGLFKYHHRNGWTVFNTSNGGLPGDEAWTLFQTIEMDGTQAIWVGMYGRGLVRLVDQKWLTLDPENSQLPKTGIRTFYQSDQEADGSFWIGTSSRGALLFTPGTGGCRTLGGQDTFLPAKGVWAIQRSVNPGTAGVLWVGTDGGGLARVEHPEQPAPALTVFQKNNSGLPSNIVWSLLPMKNPDQTETIWIGTFGNGVVRFVPQAKDHQWTVFDSHTFRLANDAVYMLAETQSKNGTHTLWAGTEGGLARLDFPAGSDPALVTPRLTTFTTENSPLPNNIVRSLAVVKTEAGPQRLWVGTDAGVAMLDPDNPQVSWNLLSDTSNPALHNNVVHHIRQDSLGRMYLFTNKGIAQLTPRTPDQENPAEFSLSTFTTEDGLPTGECSGAALLDKSGQVWVGTAIGVASFDARQSRRNLYPANPLVLEQSVINGQPRTSFGPGDGPFTPVLTYSDNNLSFEFARTGYFHEAETEYRSQLIGFENKAVEWSNEYRRIFTNLPPGTFQLQVWARDYQGTVVGPLVIPFVIKPAPWRTWWAYAFYVMVGAGWVYGSYRWRVRSLRLSNLQLERKIRERTFELDHKNSELAETVSQLQLSEAVTREKTLELAQTVEQLRLSEQTALEARNKAQESEVKALEASQAKSIFLARMSHELRTPLNAILGFVQLLERDAQLRPDQRENLGIINRSGEHLLGLINDILSISKIEAGRVILNEQTFNLRRLFEGLEEMFRMRAAAKKVELHCDMDPSLPRSVWGDEGKLRQIFINLLGNAFKFTDQGRVTLRGRWYEGEAEFEIEDTGKGIAPDEMDKLFKAFSQTQSGVEANEGTGLGLVISQTFVQLMGGSISVESSVGQGTVFQFRIRLLPAVEVPAQPQPKKVVGLESDQTSFRIVVADDKWENRTLLARLLEPVGFEVREAGNGEEAVAMWREWRPHLIWMDMHMPVLDGFSATKIIRRTELSMFEELTSAQRPNVIILALSASAFDQDRKTFLNGGCNDFVAKPYRESTIFEKMAFYLGVRYVYEEDAAGFDFKLDSNQSRELKEDHMVQIPVRELERLHYHMTAGDTENALRVVEKIRLRNPDLAEDLRVKIKAYRFDDILEAIEACLASPTLLNAVAGSSIGNEPEPDLNKGPTIED